MYGYSEEQLKKRTEELNDIAREFIAGARPERELPEFVDRLTPVDAFIFGQCCGDLLVTYSKVKTGTISQ